MSSMTDRASLKITAPNEGRRMQYPNEHDTKTDILEPKALQLNRQHSMNQETMLRYEALSYFERKEVIQWLKYNLAKIPMLGKIKREAMAKLLAGDYYYPSTLVLIRHTLSVLHL